LRALHRLERAVLKAVGGGADLEALAKRSGLSVDQVRRAVEWLKDKGLISVEAEEREGYELTEAGERAIELGLPESRLVKMVKGGPMPLSELARFFSEDELSAGMGRAKRAGWIRVVKKGGERLVEFVREPEVEPEEVLRRVKEGKCVEEGAVSTLVRRGYLRVKKSKCVRIRLTEDGAKALRELGEEREIERLTPELLSSGGWRGLSFRPYDVEAPVKPTGMGKKHPLTRLIDEVREIFVSMGFEEVDGPLIQPAFWNFDVLFIPQDHPARDMQDTFYVEGVVDRIDGPWVEVARVHENGGGTGSRGWGYRWSYEEARRLVLRTHTTAVSVRYLAERRPEEAKVFSVGRVFRNEKVTRKHLIEFHQIEGIATGKGLSIRDLMGLMKEFYRRLGLKRVKFWPTYFPYTEPSLQSMVYHEGLGKWIELCGMGIFRPEVTLPLGVKNPVLAWGGGLERIAMLKYGLDDIRELYRNRMGWLRGCRICP